MVSLLICAEKPSQAQKFADVFSRKPGKTDGYIECFPHRLFPNRDITITWTIGHLTELQDPAYYNPEYEKWNLDNLPIIPETPALRVKQKTAKQFGIVKRLMNDPKYEFIINGADAGREGSLLFENTYRLAGCQKPVKRLWTSSLEKSELEKAFDNLLSRESKHGLYLAGAARQFADWLVGINSTRAYSLKIQSSGTAKHFGGNSVFSIGRVQTPTLAIVVKREREIQNFKPTPYHELWATFKTNVGEYRGIYVKAPDNRFSQKQEAITQESLVKGKSSTIKNIKREQKEYKPPQFFSLNELQMEANKRFKWTPDQTLKTAQSLYDNGYLTYPRTDSRYITEAEADTIPSIMAELKMLFPEYQPFIPNPLPYLKGNKRYVDRSKVTDHYAVLPTKKIPDLNSLTENERKLYDLVVRSVIVAHMEPAIMEYTEFLTSVGNHSDFLTKGKVIMKESWRSVWFDKNQKDDDEDNEDEADQEGILPPVQEGMPGMVIKTEIKDKKTKSPKRYTAGNMIQVMKTAGLTDLTDEELIRTMKEVEGLGTVATRAAIIKELETREYIKISRNKVYATEKGIYLISILEQSNSILAKPDLTAQWESALTKISKQQYDANAFIKQVKMLANKSVADAKALSMGELTELQTESTSKSVVKTGPTSVGECPSCKSPVMEREKFYGCSNYKECDFKIPKTILGKNITKTHMKSLLTKGQTSIIKGFTGKNGEFDAAFRYNLQTKKLDWIRG
ncbi:type IA DNA topoisomerase [Niallia taxi]|uniref:type IA DNA topoisomerase n=1 Tax=Niallia taxi TaxID=2499688 RepID=UPI0015F67815|nr:type IA DNA topoisomerase [Niallia taxi]